MSTVSTPAILKYETDPAHTAAHFKVRHLMISNVKGEFTRVKATAVFDPSNLAAASVEASIDVSSINTREPQRDAHLKSPDFLDAATYPEITFRSKKFTIAGKDAFEVNGDLTIRGVTREVNLLVEDVTPEAKDPWGNFRRGATATTTINRKDFGLNWNMALETGGWLVGDDVHISIDAEFVRKPQ
jgi:polyisoprenoid-binding protein YceI